MGAVHLGVVELERDTERCPEKSAAVSAPYQKWVVEDAAVHADCAVDLALSQGGGADDHAFGKIMIGARLGDLPCKAQIVVVEASQIVREGDVARADLALSVGDDSVYGDRVVKHKSAVDGQHVELRDVVCGAADAPAHKHIELDLFSAAQAHEVRYVERLEERYHRHRRLHPHLECVSA